MIIMDPAKRTTYIIAAVAFVIILIGIYFLFIFQKGPNEPKRQESGGEVKQLGEIEFKNRPYVTLTPTSDGAEIIISMENMGNFDRIEYELIYLADNPQIGGEKIQRGSTGTDVNPKDQKYKKSILLGTASRGVRSPDRGITDGKLNLHLFKGETEFNSETDWDLIEVGSKIQTITNRAGNFKLKAGPFQKQYWIIIADTVGIPPDATFEPGKVIPPVYGIFSIAPNLKNANLLITLAEDAQNVDLYSYTSHDSKWQILSSEYNQSTKTITTSPDFFATFVAVKK